MAAARAIRRWGILLIVARIISYGIAINLARPLQQRNGALPVIVARARGRGRC